ncbi:DUF6973 domain-containing protein [Dyadobacter luticola]|uniref:DUF6973 domain-containing protein n=1 Tax=Dyadobacter luticola TaxID=1979387 RepID=A0A5R9KRU4_9BACT|nr:hypothetical protein [Dyadobacter luticola]TLU98887.1 hypothetical protein FEN17_20055 [Dyadobacter luticola]
MNVLSKSACFLFALWGLLACNKPEILQESTLSSENVKDTIDFRGEIVAVLRSFPKRFLNQSAEDFDAYYAAQNREANVRTNGEGDYLTAEEMLAVLQPLAKKYPDLSWEKEISEPDLRRIYADFKSITTVEEVREKSDLILAFYNDMFKPEAVAAIIAYKKTRKRGRTETIFDPFGIVFPYEESKILSVPIFAPLYMMSGATAKEMAQIYGKAEQGRRGDAFRHGAWNCLVMRNLMIAGASKSTSVEYAQKCITAHEREDQADDPKTLDAAMDLFNNLSARTWMYSSTSWGVGPNRIMPSEFHIRDQMKTWADNAGWIFKDWYLQQIVIDNQGNTGNWGALYGACTGNFQHLMYYIN